LCVSPHALGPTYIASANFASLIRLTQATSLHCYKVYPKAFSEGL
jgi:hypothetical protein